MPDSVNLPHDYICSTLSTEAGEALFGTASQVEVYFLLEYNRAWQPKAVEQSELPEPVKAHLTQAVKKIPLSKVLLIKGQHEPVTQDIRFFIAIASEDEPRLYEYKLETYDDLLALDLPALVKGEVQVEAHRRHRPLFLVCTNGRRDPCCVRYGLWVFGEMVKMEDGLAWQCTHVGGHRFAANVLCLPHGLLYGRIRAENVADTLEAYRNGEVVLDFYRGRSCYQEVVQAADYYLRLASGNFALGAYHWIDTQEKAPDQWQVRFLAKGEHQVHQLKLALETKGVQIYQSCRPAKLTPVTRYNLAGYEVLGAQDTST